MRPNWYRAKDITPKTRLSDLVTQQYHPQLKLMIRELCLLTSLTDKTEWWRVRRLEFTNPRTQRNYVPIAKFVRGIKDGDEYGLKCSLNTFLRYITSPEHSNLNAKWNSVKTLVLSRIRYEMKKTKR